MNPGEDLKISGEGRAGWTVVDGGQWLWLAEGVQAQGCGQEWVSLGCAQGAAAKLWELGNFSVEVSVTGKAEAAGLSFGPYQDFLTPVAPETGTRRVQLEVDAGAGSWTFRVDGRLTERRWWDAGVNSVKDILGARLHFKGRGVEDVRFHDLAVHRFAASCRLSVIITCHRFLQRLRVCLRNWCSQSLPGGALEILVANPQSPDGTHEHMAAVAQSYPAVRVRELPVESHLATNKINRAVAASKGEVIWLTDADCLFSPTSAAAALDYIAGRGQRVFYAERRLLSSIQTARLLSGQLDGLRDFEALALGSKREVSAPWGYTQIVERSILERLPYSEELLHFAGTDNLFINDCYGEGIAAEQIPGLFCLHLDHPFAWYGTTGFM
jgi:hypothetical protein